MTSPNPAPPVPDLSKTALFLDLDGTLIDFAPSPMAVQIAPRLLTLLQRLEEALDGALAVVTGRRIDVLDQLLSPLVLPAAGLHGAERRDARGRYQEAGEGIRRQVADVASKMHRFAASRPGVLVEDKGAAVALHYRVAESSRGAVLEFAQQLSTGLSPALCVQNGHMVVEVRPAGIDKGGAIRAFMLEAPFSNRQAVFVGDDRTDEQGFEYVNAVAGLSVKVGVGDTCARTRLANPDAVLEWLESTRRPASCQPA